MSYNKHVTSEQNLPVTAAKTVDAFHLLMPMTALFFAAIIFIGLSSIAPSAHAQDCSDSNVLCDTRHNITADDNDKPAGKSVHSGYNFSGTGNDTVILLDFAPHGTQINNLEVAVDENGAPTLNVTGASTVVARRSVSCNNGVWERGPATGANACTQVLAANNCNRCGYCENFPGPPPPLGIGVINFPSDLQNNPFLPGQLFDISGNIPEVGYESGRVRETPFPEYCNLTYDELVAQGYIDPENIEEIGGNSQNGDIFVPPGCVQQSQIPEGTYVEGEYSAIPERVVELFPSDRGDEAKIIAYPFCADEIIGSAQYKYIRVDFTGDHPAGVFDGSQGLDELESIIVPSRCDNIFDPQAQTTINDYKIFVDTHLNTANDIDVDVMCPPAVFKLCPNQNDINGGQVAGTSIATNGITPIPQDPQCGSNGLFRDYVLGSGNSARFCECNCSGSGAPNNGAAPSCSNACGSEAGRTDRDAVSQINLGNTCGPNASIVNGSMSVDANGQVSWQCRWQDQDNDQPNPFPITSGPRSFDNQGVLTHSCSASLRLSGVCGANNGGTFDSLAANDVNNCATGDVASFTTDTSTNTISWTCQSPSSGTDASCSATLNAPSLTPEEIAAACPALNQEFGGGGFCGEVERHERSAQVYNDVNYCVNTFSITPQKANAGCLGLNNRSINVREIVADPSGGASLGPVIFSGSSSKGECTTFGCVIDEVLK